MPNSQQQFDWKRYLIVFFITLGLFLTAIYLSNYFSNRKLNQLKTIQDKISIDILSSETQFSLLSEMSCKNVSDSALSGELGELGQKIEWGQSNIGSTEELTYLKNYYSLLQIKDYLLMKKISARCGKKAAFVLYFYTTAQNCSDCEKESLVLSTLRSKYPELRVYSFDYSTDLSAVKAMLNIYRIKDTALPALVIDDNLRTGFQPIESVEKLIKASFKLSEVKPETTKK
jgi:thiol-disulfide isomerase/thioredoxin